MDSFHSKIDAGSGARSASSEHLSEEEEEMFAQIDDKDIQVSGRDVYQPLLPQNDLCIINKLKD